MTRAVDNAAVIAAVEALAKQLGQASDEKRADMLVAAQGVAERHAEEAVAEKIDAIAARMDALETSIEGLVKAWEGATFLVAAAKWMSGVVIAGSALVYALLHFGQGK